MQKIFEPIIYIVYLSILIFMGRYMLVNSVGKKYYKIFGDLCMLLVLADAFYLIPRMYAILTTGIEDNISLIGWGRMGNAILITLFYMVLYGAYNVRFNKKKNTGLDKTIYGLGIVRIIICLLPGNQWFELTPSSTYSIARLVPIIIMGILLALITYLHGKKYNDKCYKGIAIMTILSILFLEPRAILPEKPVGILILTMLRTITIFCILFFEYKRLRDINMLSRY